MNYKQFQILLLASLVVLVSCDYSQGVAANPAQATPTVSPQKDAEVASTDLTYKLETYNSKVMGGKRTYGVSLPPGYEQNRQQRYPVIFLLHGGHGDPTAWFDQNKGQALKTLAQLYATGKLPPSIIITPDGNDKRGTSPYWDPQYFDGPEGKVSTAVGDELVKLVKIRYRTLSNPNFWAMGGLSSGGWGALNVGLHNLQRFSIFFSHSGYFEDKSGPQNSPIIYIKNLAAADRKKLRIYLDSGTSDAEELAESQKFSQVLKQLKIYHTFREFPGGHTWQYWSEHLADSLTFVGEQFRASQIANGAVNVEIAKPKNSPSN